MAFFERIKSKLKWKNLMYFLLFLLPGFLMILFAFQTGFSWETNFRFRIGLPVPNWLLSGLLILFSLGFFYKSVVHLISFLCDAKYRALLQSIERIGDVATCGAILEAMEENPYANRGDLRFNEYIVFYMEGTDVTAFSPQSITAIRGEIERVKNVENTYVCIYYENKVLKISASDENAVELLKQLRNQYGVPV